MRISKRQDEAQRWTGSPSKIATWCSGNSCRSTRIAQKALRILTGRSPETRTVKRHG